MAQTNTTLSLGFVFVFHIEFTLLHLLPMRKDIKLPFLESLYFILFLRI